VADPDKDVKPYPDNVWLLKRIGRTMLAFFVALTSRLVASSETALKRVRLVSCSTASTLCGYGRRPRYVQVQAVDSLLGGSTNAAARTTSGRS
jgi:hypothetical protein